VRIIEGDFDSLVERFGASRRLATRTAALARKGLLLSEALVELACAADGKALNDWLLSKATLDQAEHLTPAQLANILPKSDGGFFEEHPLSLQPRGERRVLCLAEEAEEAPAAPAASQALSVAPAAAIASLIGGQEAAKLLTPDEISRLKLDLLTSADQGRRLEAVRKLWLAGLGAQEKLQLFLAALRDREAEVRAEAARALGALGLDQALTENIAKASAASQAERVVAIANLGQILPRLDNAQHRLALGVVAGFVRPSEPREVVLASLGLLAMHLGRLEGAGEFLATLHKEMVDLAQVQQSQYEEPLRDVYGAMYGLDRGLVSRLLIATAEESSVPALQFFALATICRYDLEGAAEPRIVRRLVTGVQTGNDLDRNYQACLGALSQLRERAVGTLVESLPQASESGQERIVGLMGTMLRVADLSPEAGRQMARACLDLYPAASVNVRVVLLESGFYEREFVDEKAKRAAAEHFIADLHTFRFERQIELLQTALRRCGRAAIGPLTQGMTESAHDVTRLTAAHLLPDVVEHDAKISARELEKLVIELRKLIEAEESSFPTRGPLYVALARIAAHERVSGETASAVGKLLRSHVGKSSAVYDVIDALGYLAAGASLGGPERIEIGHLLLSFVKRAPPTVRGGLKKNAQGEEVFEFGRETTAYTDMIPRVLEGLSRLLDSSSTPKGLYQKVLADLSQLWRDVTDYKMIWAPASVLTLGRLLGRVALSGRESERSIDDIAELLARRSHLLPIMQVLGEMATVSLGSTRLNRILAGVMNELVRRLSAEQEPEMVERRQILESMFQIACRPELGEKPGDADHARRAAVEALFDAMKERLLTASSRQRLEALSQLKHVSESLRSDIKRRLKPLGERR